MRMFLLLVTLLLGFSLCLAAEQPADKRDERVEEQGKKKQQQVKTGKPGKEKPVWPRPYRPREEVSADSVVPFPTDI